MAVPPDAPSVLNALRLGWAFAEVRGRLNTWPPPDPRVEVERPERELPLTAERTWLEQTIETEEIVIGLAQGLKVDLAAEKLTGQHGGDLTSSRLVQLSKDLHSARVSSDSRRESVKWEDACAFLYAWDAKIQDTLAACAFTVASAYQLGRGLAETYWALDPTVFDENDWHSPSFLLGSGRQEAFQRMLPRLSAYFTAATTRAVQASLAAWGQVAKDDLFRVTDGGVSRPRPGMKDALHAQLGIWHDLLLVGQKPETRVDAKELFRHARRIGPVLKAFAPEVSISLLSLIAAVAAAVLFALGSGSKVIAPVLAVLTFFGVTSAGALAKAKGQAQSLFDELRQAMDADLVKEAVTLLPARTYLDRKRLQLGGDTKQRAIREFEAQMKRPLPG